MSGKKRKLTGSLRRKDTGAKHSGTATKRVSRSRSRAISRVERAALADQTVREAIAEAKKRI